MATAEAARRASAAELTRREFPDIVAFIERMIDVQVSLGAAPEEARAAVKLHWVYNPVTGVEMGKPDPAGRARAERALGSQCQPV